MTDKPSQDDQKAAEERFNRTVRNLLNTPPKPHKNAKGREPKPAPKRG